MPSLHFQHDIQAVALVGTHALPRGVPRDTTPPSLQPDEGEEAEDIMLRATKDMGYELKVNVYCSDQWIYLDKTLNLQIVCSSLCSRDLRWRCRILS